jgi:hypothetical protein
MFTSVNRNLQEKRNPLTNNRSLLLGNIGLMNIVTFHYIFRNVLPDV